MDIEDVKLQFRRLNRHYIQAKLEKDPISFLDLSHCLRIWADLKTDIDKLVTEQGITLHFGNPAVNRKLTNIFKNTSFEYAPLAAGVESPGLILKSFMFSDRIPTSEERDRIFKMGPPPLLTTNLTFSEWLGSTIILKNIEVDGVKKRHDISRERLIRRVANLLGASHPKGSEKSSEEKQFDVYIKQLQQLEVSNGYPFTYYQLIEIADQISQAFKDWLSD